MLFPGNKARIECYLDQLSREDPSPPLPGGCHVGNELYYVGPSGNLENGDRMVYGQRGTVLGPATLDSYRGKGLAMVFPGNKGRIECYLNQLSLEDPNPPLPGGCRTGEELYYLGASGMLPSGDKLVYGQRGTVAGPPSLASYKGRGVAMAFPGNKGRIECYLDQLSRADPGPPLPGGVHRGEELYYLGASGALPGGGRLLCGQRGKVAGPASLERYTGRGVAMLFPGNEASIECYLAELSREPPGPVLLGGHRVGEELYYLGASGTLSSGDRLTYGARGRVAGPATLEEYSGRGVAMLFPGNRAGIECFLKELSREPPLPGGHRAGQELYYLGASGTLSSGDRLVYGWCGKVVGAATLETYRGRGLAMLFPGNKSSIECALEELAPQSPGPPLLGGYHKGEELYFLGTPGTLASGDKLPYACRGRVVGPATLEGYVGRGLAMLFPGNASSIECFVEELSRELPGAALPGGYRLGEELHYLGPSGNLSSGDALTCGSRGTVVGPASLEKYSGRGLAMMFPGNKSSIECYLDQLARK